jgi:hypothetical protein
MESDYRKSENYKEDLSIFRVCHRFALTIFMLEWFGEITFLRNHEEQSNGKCGSPGGPKASSVSAFPASILPLAKPGFCLKYFVLALPRGVTVTQRPLEALFMVRIHAR